MVVSIVTSHDWDGLQAEGDWKEPEAMKNLIQRTKKMWPNREHFWVSRSWIYRKNLKKAVIKLTVFFYLHTESYPGKIKEHRFLPSKNLWADLSKFLSEIWSSLSQCEWIMSIFKRVGLVNLKANLSKTAKKRLSF